MFEKKKLSTAVASALAVSLSAGVAQAQMLEEIIVTATKRAESMQDIPVTIQAMSGDAMSELGVSTFDEYVKYLPNVVQQGRGPGRSEIYIRGVATEQSNNTVSSVQGSSPAVALYLDEQPISLGGRNLDIYAADLARVEVLPGPQGTLFGASSQSGTVRLITNKPVQDEFQAGFKASFGNTSGGESSTSGEAYFNVPLTDKLAVRATLYNDNQGGWIDNKSMQFNSDDSQLIQAMNRNQIFGARINDDATIIRSNNAGLIEDDWNDATYRGMRIGVAYDINDDWDVLLQHSSQQLDAEGVFEYNPVLGGSSSSSSYSPASNSDEFGLTTWTVNGRIGMLDVVYTGGFLDRDVYSLIDYTLYSFGGGYQVYYITSGGYTTADTVYDFTKQYVDNTNNERTTHEFRIQTDSDQRIRGTAGIFIDETITKSIGEFQYLGAVDAGFDVAIRPTTAADGSVTEGVNNSNGRGQTTIFVNDFTRTEDQTAFFADVSFDITDSVTLSLGARRYEIDFDLKGATGGSFGCKGDDPATLPTDVTGGGRQDESEVRPDGSIGCSNNAGNNVTARLAAAGALAAQQRADGVTPTADPTGLLGSDGVVKEEDTILKATLDWKISDNVLTFLTWSEGFRPPVSNRNANVPSGNQELAFEGYVVPSVATTDELTNIELGIKGDFLDGAMRLNATYYRSEIDNLQTTRFDPSNIAFLVFIENVGDAEVQGIDLDFQWAATENLTIMGAASWVDSEITRLNAQLEGLAAPVGSALPYSAEFSFNLRARYEFPLNNFGGDGFVQAGVTYTGDSLAGIIGNAYFIEDNTTKVYGVGSGLKIQDENSQFGGTGVTADTVTANSLTTDQIFGTGDTVFRNGRYVQESYALVGLSAGIRKDNWMAEVYVDNVADEDAITHISTFDYTPTVSVARPRTIGLRLAYDFE